MYLSINNITIRHEVPITVLQLCNLMNIYIPRFCYHEKLSIVGSCRMCLVEIYKILKPVVACATPIQDTLTVYTDTVLIKNSRESILEFLLINHPLDCPICDQGGECDLQDQALIYGSDVGRFKGKKRAVFEKYLGLLIKTVMIRCIHCTRCVRFMSEIALENTLGILGRNKNMEIGTYAQTNIKSILSGNLIDICPVGALTSKPFSFSNRPWELKSVESVDILDGFGSSIRLDFKGSEIVRILPKINESINECWITDKIRFTYDSFRYRRITAPSVLKKKWFIKSRNIKSVYINLSWELIIQIMYKLFIYYYVFNYIQINVGNLIDFETVYFTNKFINLLGIANNYFKYSYRQFNLDIRENYTLNRPIISFNNNGVVLFIGSNLELESPLLNIRLNKQKQLNKKNVFGFFGSFLKNINNSYQLGISCSNVLRIFEGKHFFVKQLINYNNIIWLTNIYQNNVQQNLFNNINTIFKLVNKVHYNSILHLDCTAVGIYDLGINTKYKNLTKYVGLTKLSKFLIYNIGSELELKEYGTHNKYIYQGHHIPIQNQNEDAVYIFLPSSLFIEKTRMYINTEGRLLFTKKAVFSPGLAKEDVDILNIFFNFMKLKKINLLKRKYLFFFRDAPYLYLMCIWRLFTLYFFLWYIYYTVYINTIYFFLKYTIINNIYIYIVDNYYNTNILNLTSKILSKINMKINNYNYLF